MMDDASNQIANSRMVDLRCSVSNLERESNAIFAWNEVETICRLNMRYTIFDGLGDKD